MGERIGQFCENLRIKLTSIDKDMESLKAKIDGKARTAQQDVRSHLDGVTKRIEQDPAQVAAAQADIKKWVEERKATTSEKIAEWKTKREIANALVASRRERRGDCGVEASPGRRILGEHGEVIPMEVIIEVLGGDTAMRAQEALESFMAVVDGLDVEVATDALSGRLVQHLMGDLHLGGAGGQSLSTVGDKEGVFRQDRIEDGLDGVAIGGRQDRADGGAATIGRDQNRYEFVRKSAFARFSSTLSGFAVRQIGDELAVLRAFPFL